MYTKVICIFLLLAIIQCQRQQRDPSTQQQNKFSPSDFSQDLFSYKGSWKRTKTNCTDYEGCIPTVDIEDGETTGEFIVKIAYPDNQQCELLGVNGKNETAVEKTFFGVWNDTNKTSPLFGSSGILRVNNFTAFTLQTVTSEEKKEVCFAEWEGPKTVKENQNQNFNWSGLWSMQQNLAGNQNQGSRNQRNQNQGNQNQNQGNQNQNQGNQDQQSGNQSSNQQSANQNDNERQMGKCCIPQSPVIVKQSSSKTSGLFLWQLPECENCGTHGGVVVSRVLPISQGAVRAEMDEAYIYLMDNEYIIAVSDMGCANLWQKEPISKECV